jgi:polar amino acid transport system substrate-binding protein
MATRRRLIQVSGGALAAAALGRNLQVYAQDSTPEAFGSPVVSATPSVEIGDISVLPLREEGKLIIHADEPVYEPWFVDNDPSNRQGFESEVAYAVAEKLGFTEDQVEWGRTPFNNSYAPGPKPFDFYITDVSNTPERARAVGFSYPYNSVPLVVVTKADGPVMEATSLEDLAQFKWGTQVGTTFHSYIEDHIQPDEDIYVYDTNADSLTALMNDTVEAVVQTLQIGVYNVEIQFEGLALGGLLPDSDQYTALVTELDSPLVPYLDAAVIALWNDGTIQALQEEYLAAPPGLETYEK